MTPSLNELASPFRSVAPPELSNRNVQFIAGLDVWNLWMAGVEGGLICSSDRAESWNWAIRHEPGVSPYPYIKLYSLVPANPDALIVGGYDKAADYAPFVSLSTNRGRSWTDISDGLREIGKDLRHVPLLSAHPDGRLLVATYDAGQEAIVIAELRGL